MTKPSDEGEPCSVVGCTGTLELPPTENCSCHIAPPCFACLERKLACSVCEQEPVDG